ncbi:MAG: efflux RND transporter periplasmic adaptor subunit [Parvibaculum sp.]
MHLSSQNHLPAWSLGLAGLILILGLGIYAFFEPGETHTSVDANASERRILYYRNPMGLADTSPTPKQDSMGMDYIPVYEGEDEEAGTIRVSADKQQRTGVRTTRVINAPLTRSLNLPGIVTLDERRVSVISLRANAFIEAVADVTTGARLQEGDPLVTLYAPDFVSAAALYASDLRSGERRAEGSRQRLRNLGVPDNVISRIASTGKAPVSIQIRAPRNGIVMERMAVEGMMAEPGAPLFRIADTSQIWVMADIPESDLGLVSRGDKASVRFRALPGETFTGEIIEIYPELNLLTRTARLRIDLANEDGRLLIGMFAEVGLNTGQNAKTLQVPDTAIIDTGTKIIVLKDLGEGRFAPQDVTLGRRGNGMVEVTEGLTEGQSVVSAATFLIDAESNLKAALANLAPNTTEDPTPAPTMAPEMDHSNHGSHAE